MNLPDIPEYIANYFNFIIDFVVNPKKACEKYKGMNKVDKDLLTFAAVGIALTWITISVTKKISDYYGDNSQILTLPEKIDMETLTLISIPTLLFVALLIHLMVKLILYIGKENFTGVDIKNTINGILAFFSFAPFLLFFLFLIIMIVIYNLVDKEINPYWLLTFVSPLTILSLSYVFWYFPAALRFMQPNDLRKPFRKAITNIYVIIMLLYMLVNIIIN